MNYRFDDLWEIAADDGASTPVGVSATMRAADSGLEVDQLIDAWYRERTGRIECSLVLDEACRLLTRLLAEGEIAPSRQKQARRLIGTIRRIQRDERDGFRP
jgi:hypothetical protein